MDTTKRKITIAYAGTLGYAEDLNVRTSVLRRLRDYIWTYNHNQAYSKSRSALPLFRLLDQLPLIWQERVEVTLWGNIDRRNSQLAEDLGIQSMVHIQGARTKRETAELLGAFDLLYLPLEMNPKEHETLFIPGKLFEYLSKRKQVLCFSEKNDVTRILENSGLGVVIDPTDVAEGVKQLIKVFEALKKDEHPQINEVFISKFERRNKVKELEEVLIRVVGS